MNTEPDNAWNRGSVHLSAVILTLEWRPSLQLTFRLKLWFREFWRSLEMRFHAIPR